MLVFDYRFSVFTGFIFLFFYILKMTKKEAIKEETQNNTQI